VIRKGELVEAHRVVRHGSVDRAATGPIVGREGFAPAPAADAAKPADQTAKRLASRSKGLEFEIPLYKYESIFKPLEELLEKKPEPAAKGK
jgi:hypothetical protein